ncbi:MAG: nucleotidyltransferase domain-containing protein [Candidatus Hodarchaeales archaeon]|jgi:hypothetical protein
MKDFNKPWYIAGGWAIDLFLGLVTRSHQDIEIIIFRNHQIKLREYLCEWKFWKVIPKIGLLEPWFDDEWLDFPIHEIYALQYKGETDNSVFEILLNESDGNSWLFRRNLNIKRSLETISKISEDGIPYLCPEIVLLYKAKTPKIYDECDFGNVHRLLDQNQLIWLSQAINQFHPGHKWLKYLKIK